jgi:hypothetical protein
LTAGWSADCAGPKPFLAIFLQNGSLATLWFCMNADELEIYDFLKTCPANVYVSVMEISKKLGHRKRFDTDRTWARPFLRRMELDGVLESNPFGEYRIRQREGETATFKQALEQPNVPLGDTTIITLDDVEGDKKK